MTNQEAVALAEKYWPDSYHSPSLSVSCFNYDGKYCEYYIITLESTYCECNEEWASAESWEKAFEIALKEHPPS